MKNIDILCCVCKQRSDLKMINDVLVCTNVNCHHSKESNCFRIINGSPIIISEVECDTLCSADKIDSYVDRSESSFPVRALRRIVSGKPKVTEDNCSDFVSLLRKANKKSKVLIIGSGEIGNGTEQLYKSKDIEILGTDIYLSNTVDYVSDAHFLPFKSQSFDGVWIQAVLEHVVDPHKVVSEIIRVLKDEAYVYAETPFMQQVHEGPFDFQRFTLIGHRYLFKSFELIKMGGNQGAGVALSWSLRYFFWGLFRSRLLATIVSMPFTILLRFLDKFLDKSSLYDSSSGVFFLGKKTQSQLPQKDLIDLYKGMQ
ncbi:MAG: SAM-dependent methyltransferase [Chloroflexi bacterium]|nr:SAM-dependent methyltransferase [Chloroflexota bacterium]